VQIIANEASSKARLLEYIHPTQLPTWLGGEMSSSLDAIIEKLDGGCATPQMQALKKGTAQPHWAGGAYEGAKAAAAAAGGGLGAVPTATAPKPQGKDVAAAAAGAEEEEDESSDEDSLMPTPKAKAKAPEPAPEPAPADDDDDDDDCL
jgi:hypothetical protein